MKKFPVIKAQEKDISACKPIPGYYTYQVCLYIIDQSRLPNYSQFQLGGAVQSNHTKRERRIVSTSNDYNSWAF